MLRNVIVEARTEYEIFFLLTAYLESVRYCDKLNLLPEDITRLPCSGIDDVRTRLERLDAGLRAPQQGEYQARANAIVRESVDVLHASLDRLQQLASPANVERVPACGERPVWTGDSRHPTG